jgi:hypothetical protein
MAFIPSSGLRTGILTLIRDAVDGGSLEILSAGNQVLASFPLEAPAGSVTGDVWTIGIDEDEVAGEAAAGDGTQAAAARFKDSGGAVELSGLTVGLPASDADVKLVNLWISADQPVRIDGRTISFPGA